MRNKVTCPVCQNAEGGSCERFSVNLFKCDICGYYSMSYELVLQIRAGDYNSGHWDLTPVQRATLSHVIRRTSPDIPSDDESELFLVDIETLERLRSDGKLPSVAVQAANVIRFVGDQVSRSGEPIDRLPNDLHAIIGAINRMAVVRLTKELVERKKLTADPLGTEVGIDPTTGHPYSSFTNITLSLDGWEQYELEKRGQFGGDHGFIAMKFGDSIFDAFVNDVVKPSVKEGLGYDLVDMRDVARAGIIDNIMRTQIRDAAFVIVDLTHDNLGAYWEAGYAEGLGKPVIYICEKEKFEKRDTHFDTNHCTTVPWSRDNDEGFCQELTATLRRSLDQSLRL